MIELGILKTTWVKLSLFLASMCAFIGAYIMDLTAGNAEQYLAIIAVMLLDAFFGIVSAIKRGEFKTYKAIKVIKNIVTWVLILTVILSIELGFTGTGWLSETILAPFLVFQMISALKNASMAGLIQNDLLNLILDKVDGHKGIRIPKTPSDKK